MKKIRVIRRTKIMNMRKRVQQLSQMTLQHVLEESSESVSSEFALESTLSLLITPFLFV